MILYVLYPCADTLRALIHVAKCMSVFPPLIHVVFFHFIFHALGLYRSRPTDDISPMSYVVTSPPHDMLLNGEDLIYSLLSPLLPLPSATGTLTITVREALLPHYRVSSELMKEDAKDQHSDEGDRAEGVVCVVRCQGEQSMSDVCSNRQQPHFNLISRFVLIEGEGSLQLRISNRGKHNTTAVASLELPISDFVSGAKVSAKEEWFNLTDEISTHHLHRRAKGGNAFETPVPQVCLKIAWTPMTEASPSY